MLTKSDDIFAVVARSENTPELSDFWLSRYSHYLSEKYFLLHPKTHDFFIAQTVTQPVTPLGEIRLSSVLNEKGGIDTGLLQELLYIAVRFLDACLDVFPFTVEAQAKVTEFRKIGIGLTDIESFLESKNTSEKQSLIDALGEQFSKLVYRASEALAEEKGVFACFDVQKKILQNKPFIKWINLDTGTVTDGATIAQKKTQEQLKKESWEQVPRRNSHLLALPNAAAWNMWNDRADAVRDDVSEKINLPQKTQSRVVAGNDMTKIGRFALADLVKVIKKDSIFYGRIGQIVEIEQAKIPTIKLASLSTDLSEEKWSQEDLGVVDTFEVITKLDQFQKITITILLLNQKRTRLYVDSEGHLIRTDHTSYQTILQTLQKTLSNLAGGFVDVMRYRVIDCKNHAAQRVCELVIFVDAKIPTTLHSLDIESLDLEGGEATLVKNAVQSIIQNDALYARIDHLEKLLAEQKNLAKVQRREVADLEWMKKFPVFQGAQTVSLESGYQMEIILNVETGQPSSLQLKPVGEVPNSIVTIMKLVELSLAGRLKDSVQFVTALNGLASIARSTSDSLSLEIVSIVAQVLGISIDQKSML